MPALAAVTAALEMALNRLLDLDRDAASQLERLAGKRLIIDLKELPKCLVLAFSKRIDVLTVEQISTPNDAECLISTQMSTLPQLRDPSLLTSLIKQGQLEVRGDLAIAQQVADMMQSIAIDWEELLALKTTDVFAHQTFALAKQAAQQVQATGQKLRHIIGSALTEEKHLAAHKLAVLHFSDQVSGLRDDVDRFAIRLAKLEQQRH